MKELPISTAIKTALLSYRSLVLLFGGMFLLVEPLRIHAAETDAPNTSSESAFNNSFLVGEAKGIDLSRFRNGNIIVAGKYPLDIYVNGNWKGKKTIEFKKMPGEENAQTCFDLHSLSELGVDIGKLNADSKSITSDTCKSLGDWIPNANYRLNTASLRMNISIPQAALDNSVRGYVDPKLWDPGINAGILSYNFNAFNTHSSSRGGTDNTSAYLMLNAGLNLAGWQLRHDSNFSWREHEGSHWQDTATYLQHAITPWQGMLTLGDAFTSGDFFDTTGFRGVQLATDDRMLPDSLAGYAPVIRGVAQTNALVEVRQNNQLIYQTTVSPGEFIINDLYPTGYGGDLDVTVNEADGSKRRFSVPYSSVVQMLRPGRQRYALTAGKVRNDTLSKEPGLFQATYQRGFTNIITGYTGVTVSEGYTAFLLGNAIATPIGAFAVDITQANTRLRKGYQSGQSYKLSYSKLMSATNTNFAVAAYRYSTSGYLSLLDALYARDYERNGLSSDALYRQRSEYQLTVNQGLGRNWGSLYATGSIIDYWNYSGTNKQYQVGYNNFYGRVNYGLSAMRTTSANNRDETNYYLNISIPFNVGPYMLSMNSSLGYSDHGYENANIGVNGAAGKDNNIVYNATFSNDRYGGSNSSVSGEYRSRFSTLNGSFSYAPRYRQASLGALGSIVAHSDGITLTPQNGNTMVLIEAPDAAGAIVANSPGVRVDNSGYAIVPYVAPYRMTNIMLDPSGMARNVELEASSQQVAPYAGAVAKLQFKTVKGQAIIIHAQAPNGAVLPFGAEVLDTRNQVVGFVGQGSQIYLRSEESAGLLQVRWGSMSNQQCQVNYNLNSANIKQQMDYIFIESDCK